MVSLLPQSFFVERIGGSRVQVLTMVQPGANPHTYEPKPGQMTGLLKAKIYFAAGVPFERSWLGRFKSASPEMIVFNTDAGIEKGKIEALSHPENRVEERGQASAERFFGGEKGRMGHGHEEGEDPHTWLSPPLAKIHGKNILNALVTVDPDFKGLYEANYRKLEQEVDAVHDRLKALFSGLDGKAAFMVFHPAWGHFAQTYGLRQISVELEGKEVKPADLQRLIRWAREREVRVIFAQKQFSPRMAEKIAQAIGGRVVQVDPLAPDWSENLLSVAAKFKEALR